MTDIKRLEQEIADLKKQNAAVFAVLGNGPRTPNTDMLVGAAISGGDVLALARKLAASKACEMTNTKQPRKSE